MGPKRAVAGAGPCLRAWPGSSARDVENLDGAAICGQRRGNGRPRYGRGWMFAPRFLMLCGAGLGGIRCGELGSCLGATQIRRRFPLPRATHAGLAYKGLQPPSIRCWAIAAEGCMARHGPALRLDDSPPGCPAGSCPQPPGQRPGLQGVGNRWDVPLSGGPAVTLPQCRPIPRPPSPGAAGQLGGSITYPGKRLPASSRLLASDSRRSIKAGVRGSCPLNNRD